jgi:hypothetical protein
MQFRLILRAPHIHFFALLFAPFDDFHKRDERFPLIVIEVESRLVGYPTMDTSPTRVDP